MKICCIQLFVLLFAAFSQQALSQALTLDGGESKDGWSFIRSDGVVLNLSCEQGLTGKALRFDYDFTQGTGYGGIQKIFPLDLPENYEFTFYLKAESPANNFEIKFLDSTGNNVWWVNNRNYDFPGGWKKIRIKKRHIQFAWGPAEDRHLKRVGRIEFTVASFVGGKGSLWIDDLKFEPLEPERQEYPMPSASAASQYASHNAPAIVDQSLATCWESPGGKQQDILIDCKTRREFGGLHIIWCNDKYAKKFDVFISQEGDHWEKVYSVSSNHSDVSFIRLPEAEARFIRISLEEGIDTTAYGIAEIKFLEVTNSLTFNDFMSYVSRNSPPGNYPRYFSGQASYWTIHGVNNDVKEVLINEEGMVEAEKGRFSLEPVIRVGDTLFTWNNARATQSLGLPGTSKDIDFIPAVTWHCPGLEFTTGIASGGEANDNSYTAISYSFKNLSAEALDLDFFILLRPFQVNPSYQFLNLSGGAGCINIVAATPDGALAVDDKLLIPTRRYDSFGAMAFDEGNLVDFIRRGDFPTGRGVTDPSGLAQGVIRYSIHLMPWGKQEFYLVIPFYGGRIQDAHPTDTMVRKAIRHAADFWAGKVGHVQFDLPSSANKIIEAYRANLAYILVNRDRAGIQPGSRSYERSWIRDGALTSSALLKAGIVEEVRDFIDWYAPYQYENGKVPCVVDSRGPDPVPENDSHGELIYLIREYFNFTGDTAFLKGKNKNVMKAVDYIESLIFQRSTDYYRQGNDSVRVLYGLVPESISHEGYSSKPMHSYWDNFFTLKGLKDAAEIQRILGEKDNYARVCGLRDRFKENLYGSLHLAMRNHSIDYIPGCAELGDFDATSTTIALTPCNEFNNLPRPQVFNTFDRYYSFFKDRQEGRLNWSNYTPYENRLIGSFILLGQPGRAHELIDYFLSDQRPQGWHHWAEVVWKDYRLPRYIGDMPHTWVGSDFINAIRTMFVYEDEDAQALVLAPALCQDWIDAPGGMSVKNLPTYYGEVSYSVRKEKDHYLFSLSGDMRLPARGIHIRNFNGGKMPARVTVNGKEIHDFNGGEIPVSSCPAEIKIFY